MRAGLDGKHRFHHLKASYTTALAQVAPDPVVQELSRHKEFATTERYIRVADEAKRAAVDAVAGRGALDGLDLTKPIGQVAPENRTRENGPVRRKRRSA